MKICTDDAIYVQLNDIVFLNSSCFSIPKFIYDKVFRNVGKVDDSNRYEFLRFEEKSVIEFFKNVDFILDYDEIKDFSDEMLVSMAQKYAKGKNNIIKKYNLMSDLEKSINSDMLFCCDALEFKMYSLRDFYWFKHGDIDVTLPKGIEYPDWYSKKNVIKMLFKRKK